MSGITAAFSDRYTPVSEAIAHRMMHALGARGADRCSVARDTTVMLGVTRHHWEQSAGMAGDTLVLVDDDLLVVADATLYYHAALRDALAAAHTRVTGSDATHLIAAAYRAWGDRCAERLEGDFAFVVWDRADRRAVAARDFGGRRPLYYALLGRECVIASTLSTILAHDACPSDLDLTAIASDAAGLFANQHDTPYRAISVIPAGHTLTWRAGTMRTTPHWTPPPVRHTHRASFECAAEELRALLARSVAERLDGDGPTAVWMSGGWDSTAVFAAGQHACGGRAGSARLRPVSITFPPGDPGREDEVIEAVAARWSTTPHWLDIRDVPLLERPLERAAHREMPFAHVFEMGHRAIARETRSIGARVALDGSGGDQLFQVSPVYLADLLRTGRWRSLAREWRAKGLNGSGVRNFFRWAIQPLLPPRALRLAAMLHRGRPLHSHLERTLPDWIDARFAREHALVERERASTPKRASRDRAAYETHWYLAHQFFPRVFSMVFAFGLDEGIEVRAPLYDKRIIEFAVARPRTERSAGAETKRLLRHAMRGLLPEHVLAPRATRTGITGGYFARAMRETHAAEITSILNAPLSLEAAGIINGARFRRCWNDYLRTGDGALGTNLFLTIVAECWLRAQLPPPHARSHPVVHRAMSPEFVLHHTQEPP